MRLVKCLFCNFFLKYFFLLLVPPMEESLLLKRHSDPHMLQICQLANPLAPKLSFLLFPLQIECASSFSVSPFRRPIVLICSVPSLKLPPADFLKHTCSPLPRAPNGTLSNPLYLPITRFRQFRDFRGQWICWSTS